MKQYLFICSSFFLMSSMNGVWEGLARAFDAAERNLDRIIAEAEKAKALQKKVEEEREKKIPTISKQIDVLTKKVANKLSKYKKEKREDFNMQVGIYKASFSYLENLSYNETIMIWKELLNFFEENEINLKYLVETFNSEERVCLYKSLHSYFFTCLSLLESKKSYDEVMRFAHTFLLIDQLETLKNDDYELYEVIKPHEVQVHQIIRIYYNYLFYPTFNLLKELCIAVSSLYTRLYEIRSFALKVSHQKKQFGLIKWLRKKFGIENAQIRHLFSFQDKLNDDIELIHSLIEKLRGSK